MDETRLRDKLAKLEALASDRNPNAHERAAARRKAEAIRAKLPVRKQFTDPFIERLRQAARDQAARSTVSREEQQAALIHELQSNLTKLKPGDQLVAGELCMAYYLTGGLDQRQWNVVNIYVYELNERK